MTSQVMTTEQLRTSRQVHAAAPRPVEVGLTSLEGFELAQRIAKMLAASTMVPEVYRDTLKIKDGKDQNGNWLYRSEPNPNGLANCVIALNMANRMGADPLMIMQNLYIVEGRPAWSSQFVIGAINTSGKYSPLRFQVEDRGEVEVTYTTKEWKWNPQQRKNLPEEKVHTVKLRNMVCKAWAIEAATGERLESAEISMEMAVKEGWYQKNGSKWQTMPEQMLRYRAASFFGRIYAPEVLMGIRTQDEELEAIIDVTPEPVTNVAPVTMETIKQNVVKEVSAANASPAVEEAKEVDQPKKPRTRTAPKVVEEIAAEAVAEQDLTQLSQTVKSEYMLALTGATQLDAIATLENEINKDSHLLDNQRSNLTAYIETRRRVINEALAKETKAQSPAADPIKSNMAKGGLKNQIASAPTVEALKEIAATVRDYKLKLTNDDMGEVLADYAARKKFLENQQDMFAEVEEVSYVDAVIKRIQNAKSQDDINAEYSDPAFDDLSAADRERIDKEAQLRESELQD